MKIYFYYIHNLLILKKDESEFKQIFNDYYKGKSNDVEKIISYI